MADESMERSLAAAIESSASAHAAADSQHWLVLLPEQHQLPEHETTPLLDERHSGMADDPLLDEFVALLDVFVIRLALDGHDVEQILELLVLALVGGPPDDSPYRNGGFGAVPASAAAVTNLEKKTFHVAGDGCGVTGCSICLEDFEDGEEVSVMPCSQGHEFHPNCITEWLGHSNTCPICRHALPTTVENQ